MKRLKLLDHPASAATAETERSTRPHGDGSLPPLLTFLRNELQRELSIAGREGDSLPPYRDLMAILVTVCARAGVEIAPFEQEQIVASLERDSKLFGVLQPLVDNPGISDIIVTNYSKVTIQQGRKNYCTGISFANTQSYESFVERVLQRAGTSYSTKRPIADGMIGSFARIHAVHSSLCESGPYLTIRLNRFSEVGIEDLSESGLAPTPVLEYLRGMLQIGATLLVAGEVGTGKTTLARALAGTMPAEDSLLVIEDTPEIRLDHPQVRYVSTREANTDGAGRVSPSECIRGGMRMAMNRIIFGEIRDAEAAEAFIDVCASGHPGLSTIHARSALDTVTRLELFLARAQPGTTRAVLSEQIATAVQAIVYLNVCSVTGRRRIFSVLEIGPVSDGVLRQREIFRYQPLGDLPRWIIPTKVSAHRAELEALRPAFSLGVLTSPIELSVSNQFAEGLQGVRR